MEKIFAVSLAYGFLYLLIVFPITSILMSALIPKTLKAKFLRTPYYKEYDVSAYEHFPMKLHLGIHFSAMIAWPRLAKRRGIQNAKDYSPRFWIVMSYLYQYAIFPTAVLIIFCILVAAGIQLSG